MAKPSPRSESLLAALPAEWSQSLFAKARPVSLQADQTLFMVGDEGDGCYRVEGGWLVGSWAWPRGSAGTSAKDASSFGKRSPRATWRRWRESRGKMSAGCLTIGRAAPWCDGWRATIAWRTEPPSSAKPRNRAAMRVSAAVAQIQPKRE